MIRLVILTHRSLVWWTDRQTDRQP